MFSPAPVSSTRRVTQDRTGSVAKPHRVEQVAVQVKDRHTVPEWSGRGPHLIRSQSEGEQLFLRLLEVLSVVAKAYGVAHR